MTEPFDPYHNWLGIPPKDQPPSHYRLLGLEPFESKPNVIEAAADQRMAHLRTYQAGAHGHLSQKLLNEVATAKICLLNPQNKTAYDALLRQQLQPPKAPGEQFDPELARLIAQSKTPSSAVAARRATATRLPRIWLAISAAGGALVLMLVLVVIDHLYAGGGNYFGALGLIRRTGFKMVPLASSRFEDLAEVVRSFTVLKKPGATLDDFFAAADAARRKNIAPMGDMTCRADQVQVNPIGKVLEQLKGSTILVVGRDAGGQGKAILDEFGTKVISLKFPELDEAWVKASQEESAKWADLWTKAAEKVIEPNREELVKSGAMYLAMQEVMKRHNARAITINCLGGFYGGHLQAFPCLGFCQFNDEGLVGACEGDLMSTITMLAIGYLVDRPGFISDPVFDTAKNQIIYAHCVAPTKVFGPKGSSNPYHIRNHSEDRKGAAMRSLMPLGCMTSTLKFIPGQKQCVFHQGKAVENVDEDKACRTKLAAEVKGDVDKLMRGWDYGWHRVTYYGDIKEPVAELCKALGITLVEEA